ncbi:unnamed protein product [Amoebophrya sp. A120]|nr:unnamed protein product [Amoebophrya sp. A120]|eukprot:GSA120T00012084001.1
MLNPRKEGASRPPLRGGVLLCLFLSSQTERAAASWLWRSMGTAGTSTESTTSPGNGVALSSGSSSQHYKPVKKKPKIKRHSNASDSGNTRPLGQMKLDEKAGWWPNLGSNNSVVSDASTKSAGSSSASTHVSSSLASSSSLSSPFATPNHGTARRTSSGAISPFEPWRRRVSFGFSDDQDVVESRSPGRAVSGWKHEIEEKRHHSCSTLPQVDVVHAEEQLEQPALEQFALSSCVETGSCNQMQRGAHHGEQDTALPRAVEKDALLAPATKITTSSATSSEADVSRSYRFANVFSQLLQQRDADEKGTRKALDHVDQHQQPNKEVLHYSTSSTVLASPASSSQVADTPAPVPGTPRTSFLSKTLGQLVVTPRPVAGRSTTASPCTAVEKNHKPVETYSSTTPDNKAKPENEGEEDHEKRLQGAEGDNIFKPTKPNAAASASEVVALHLHAGAVSCGDHLLPAEHVLAIPDEEGPLHFEPHHQLSAPWQTLSTASDWRRYTGGRGDDTFFRQTSTGSDYLRVQLDNNDSPVGTSADVVVTDQAVVEATRSEASGGREAGGDSRVPMQEEEDYQETYGMGTVLGETWC